MRKTIILLLLTIISCKNDNTNLNYPTQENNSEKIHFELPKLTNWKEMYTDEFVKERFNENSSDGATILGVYLNNETAKQKASFSDTDFTDYSLFYIINGEQKRKIENTDLKRIFDIQINKASVRKIDINETIRKAYSDTTFITTEKPYLLKEYSKNKKAYSAIKLIKPYVNNHDFIVVYVYNLININNHLVYGGYYLDFNGIESVEKAQKNNDLIISEFIEQNK